MKRKFKKIMDFLKNPEKMKKYFCWLWEKTKPAFWSLVFLMAINSVSVVIGLASSFLSRHVVDTATSGRDYLGAFLVMILITILSLLLSSVISVFTTLINEKFAFSIRMRVYNRILDSDFTGLMRYHSGDLLTRMTSDVDSVANGVASAIPSLFTIVLRLFSAFVILFSYTPALALSALALGPVGLVLSLFVGERLKELSAQVKENEAAYRSFIQENLASIQVVKAFTAEERSKNTLSLLRERMLKTIYRRNRLSVLMHLMIRALFSLGYLIAFGYCVHGLFAKSLSYGTMTLFLTLFSQIQQPIMSISHLIPQVIGILASAGRIMEVEEIPAEARSGKTDSCRSVGLRVTNAAFSYRDIVLQNVTFSAGPGELVGIMGPSGVGKTTLIRLALAFICPEKGSVEFVTENGSEPATADSRRLISYVPQGNTLLSGTIRENLLFGKADATEEEMFEALENAAAGFVRQLPMGLDTRLGEKSQGLSEGQAQRIAIARALLRKAPVLILDEATSALDADAEEKFLSVLTCPDREYAPLCLIITHRKTMIPYFDRLVEIAPGGKTTVTMVKKN